MSKKNLINVENRLRILVLSGVRLSSKMGYNYDNGSENTILLDNESIMFLANMNCSYEDLSDVEKMNFDICRKGETQNVFDPHVGHTPVYAIINGVEVDATKYTDEEIEHLKKLYPNLSTDDIDDFLDIASMRLNDELKLNGQRFYQYEMRLETDIRDDDKYYGNLQEYLDHEFSRRREFDDVRFVIVDQF